MTKNQLIINIKRKEPRFRLHIGICFYLSALFIFILAISCEKDITVDLPTPEEKLVVDGMIELNEYPIVFLTKNAAYFEPVDTSIVNNSVIKNSQATVIVSNGYLVDTLVPALFDRWPYQGYIGTKFKGNINSKYDLKIIYNNNEYFATTTIPDTTAIDSVWFDNIDGVDSLGFLSCRWNDPPSQGNYYTIVTKVEGIQNWFYRPFFGIHLIDDKLDNGKPMVYTPLTKGYERNDYYRDPWEGANDYEYLELICYHIGDTVSIKLSTIDSESYNFWSSLYRNYMTEGNPFTNPASVKSNIRGCPANGCWIGSGAYVSTICILDTTSVAIIR